MNGLGRVEFRASQVPQYVGFGTRVWMLLPDERRIVTDLLMTTEDAKNDGVEIKPAFDLSPEESQNLMDALWSADVRPSNGEGSTGRLAATENHLEDMRVLMFTELGIPVPMIGRQK